MQEEISNHVLEAIAESPGTRAEGIYLVAMKVKGPSRVPKIEILLDTDTGIRIDQCAWLSRRVRERIEGDLELMAAIGEDFELMVASPGLGEPLRLLRQYQRHIGKLLTITWTDDEDEPVVMKGRLLQVSLSDESGPSIVILPEKKGKKGQPAKNEGVRVLLDRVVRAVPEAEL
ncbi:MAG: ribosome maturation factor RimP [Chlorobiaceae bacterium]